MSIRDLGGTSADWKPRPEVVVGTCRRPADGLLTVAVVVRRKKTIVVAVAAAAGSTVASFHHRSRC